MPRKPNDPTRPKRPQNRPRDSYPPKRYTERVDLTLEPADLAIVEALAAARGTTKTEIIRQLIRDAKENDPQ